jgi:hypothetical protein
MTVEEGLGGVAGIADRRGVGLGVEELGAAAGIAHKRESGLVRVEEGLERVAGVADRRELGHGIEELGEVAGDADNERKLETVRVGKRVGRVVPAATRLGTRPPFSSFSETASSS